MTLVSPQLLEYVRINPHRLVTLSSKRNIAVCPRQFRYALENPITTDSMTRGLEVHDQLAKLYSLPSSLLSTEKSNKNLLRDFVAYWEDLIPILPPEQPFLVEYQYQGNKRVVGGVIDLVVADDQKRYWVLDHKISTGWVPSALSALASQEQLAVYAWALEKNGIHVEGGIISQLFYIPDVGSVYAFGVVQAEGIKEKPSGAWGVLTRNKSYTRAILHDGTDTLHIERRYYLLSHSSRESSFRDLAQTWEALKDTSARIPGKHCEYCPFHVRCTREYSEGISPPEIVKERLHHEFFSRCL